MTGIWFSFSEPVQFSNSEILSIWFAMFFISQTHHFFLLAETLALTCLSQLQLTRQYCRSVASHELQHCSGMISNDLVSSTHSTHSLSVFLCWCGCLCSDTLMAVCVEMDRSGTGNQRPHEWRVCWCKEIWRSYLHHLSGSGDLKLPAASPESN